MAGINRWLHRPSNSVNDHLQGGIQTFNIYSSVIENKDVVKGMNLISTCLVHVKIVSFHFPIT